MTKLGCYFAVVAVSCCGCADNNPLGRKAVSGGVTLAGAPLATGTIQFTPLNGSGVRSGAKVEAGRYVISQANGLPVGTYRVQIFSADEDAPPEMPTLPGPGIPVSKERIPAEFNLKSKLSIEVTDEGPNSFQFTVP